MVELKRIGTTEKYDKYMMVENDIFRYSKVFYVVRSFSKGAESLYLEVSSKELPI
jgi:hypothetical protein